MAAQDFRHLMQRESESVSNFVRRLERTFQLAYGCDGMLPETRDALLYSQLQEGLRDNLMEGPAVSGAVDYQALCIAAKNEERRQVELKKWKQYRRLALPSRSSNKEDNSQAESHNARDNRTRDNRTRDRKCYHCEKVGHLARNCPQKRSESTGKMTRPSYAKKVSATEEESASAESKQVAEPIGPAVFIL